MIDEQHQAIDRVQRWRESGGWKLSVVYLCGYNPNLLLTDQRSELRKFADGQVLGEPYHPTIMNPPYHRGGVFIPSRRIGKTATMAAVLPGGEMVLPKGRLSFPTLYDKQKIQEELRRSMEVPPRMTEMTAKVGYSAQIVAEGAERFAEQIKKVGDEIARMQEKVYLRMIFSAQANSQPGDMFHREYRIGKLLFSSDRRQQKRGNRLFNQWRKRRAGINWTRDEKRALLHMGYGRARGPLDYIEPEHYRKD